MNEIGWLDNRSQICSNYSYTIQRSAKVPLYSSKKKMRLPFNSMGSGTPYFLYHGTTLLCLLELKHCSTVHTAVGAVVLRWVFIVEKNVYREKTIMLENYFYMKKPGSKSLYERKRNIMFVLSA